MWSSSLNRYFARVAACIAGLVLHVGASEAAQYFWEPELEVFAEENSNRSLVTDSSASSSQVYGASLAAAFGVATPRSESTIRPRIRYQNYSDQEDATEFEGGVEFVTAYESPLTTFNLYGRADHQDLYNAELADARFNELDPENSSSPETGRVDGVGETRDMWNLHPSFRYRFTPRFDIRLEGAYEEVDYSAEALTGRIDYAYINAGAYPGWKMTERLGMFLGVYGARYAAADETRKSDSTGASIGMEYEWTKLYKTEFSIIAERTKIDDRVPVRVLETVDTVGGRFSLTRQTPITSIRAEVSDTVAPSGGGGVTESRQFHIQYDRHLSQRFELLTAGLYYQERVLASADKSGDIDYATAEASLRWNVTRTWFLFGGYRYIWQEYVQSNGQTADNNTVFAGFGYRGLGRQRQ